VVWTNYLLPTSWYKMADYMVLVRWRKSSVASKYKSEFTFRAPDGIEQISKTLFVRRCTEDLRQVSENSALHVGQHCTLYVQLLQMLWRSYTAVWVAGTMYCVQTGHFSSINNF
jgi:hypothetical protein